jgi:hypothetical protein
VRINFYITTCVFFLTVGCNSPDPHPEDADPMFASLKSAYTNTTKDTKAAQDAADEARKHISDLPPSLGGYTYYQRKYFQLKSKAELAEQSEHYAELRMLARKEETIKRYVEAFKSGSHWPPDYTAEMQAYQTKLKLESEPKAWGARSPKWTRGMASKNHESKKAEPAHGSAEHSAPAEHGE